MIMRGTAQKSLGWGGGLLALSLSAAILPFSPTWADDAKGPGAPSDGDLHKRTFVFTSPDEVHALKGFSFTEAVPREFVYTVSDDPAHKETAKRIEIHQSDIGAPGQVLHLEGLGDGQQLAVITDYLATEVQDADEKKEPDPTAALNRALERLKKQVAELKAQKDGEKSSAAAAKAEALQQAIRALEEAKSDPNRKARVIIRRTPAARDDFTPPSGEKLTPEMEAARAKLQDEMKALGAQVQERQAEVRQASERLREAQRKLAEASRKLAQADQQRRISVRTVERRFGTPEKGEPIREYFNATPRTTTENRRFDFQVAPRAPGAAAEKKLADLEKKLNAVLEQLESLKKEKASGGQPRQ
jgi:hypothetical protein